MVYTNSLHSNALIYRNGLNNMYSRRQWVAIKLELLILHQLPLRKGKDEGVADAHRLVPCYTHHGAALVKIFVTYLAR